MMTQEQLKFDMLHDLLLMVSYASPLTTPEQIISAQWPLDLRIGLMDIMSR
jgi:hypothetical protein